MGRRTREIWGQWREPRSEDDFVAIVQDTCWGNGDKDVHLRLCSIKEETLTWKFGKGEGVERQKLRKWR